MYDSVTPSGVIILPSPQPEPEETKVTFAREQSENRTYRRVGFVSLFILTLPIMAIPYGIIAAMVARAVAADKKMLREIPSR
jgi:hypothetical protein